MIIIKKYPNRRLYDTAQSRYINIDAVKGFIRSEQPFVVRDSKSGLDITRQILLQIICDHEASQDTTILPRSLLTELIRQYGGSRQQAMRTELEAGLAKFLNSDDHSGAANDDEAEEQAASQWRERRVNESVGGTSAQAESFKPSSSEHAGVSAMAHREDETSV